MKGYAGRWTTFAGLVLTLLATGCASVGSGGGPDSDGLNNALTSDDVGAVRGAVQSGVVNANQRIPTAGYPDGAPLIAIAARAGSVDVTRYLISAGADINARTPVFETPLMLASFFFDERQRGTARAFERHEQIVRLLVGAGAELENDPGRYTPLAYAAYQGNERVVRFLLDRGANVDSSASNGYAYVNTPLMMAAMQGYENIVRTLLRAGANPDVRVRGGHTAAELAFKYNHTSLARLLQQCGLTQRAMNASHCVAALGYDPRERQSALRVD